MQQELVIKNRQWSNGKSNKNDEKRAENNTKIRTNMWMLMIIAFLADEA